MAAAEKTILQLDQQLVGLVKEIARLGLKGGGADLDAAVVAYRRAGLNLSSNLGQITKAMKEAGSSASRSRTGEGVVLPPGYEGIPAGFGIKDGEKWPSGFKVN